MPARSLDGRARWALPLATLAALAVLGAVRWALADGPVGLGLDALLAAAAIGGTLEAARRARPGRSRLGWRFDTMALLAWLLAPFAWLAGLPDVVATVGRLGFVLMIGAAWWFTSHGRGTWSRVRLTVDGAIAGGALLVVAWSPLLEDTFVAAGDGVTGAVAVALPLATLAVLTLVAGVTVTEIPRHRRAMPRLTMVALSVIAASDVLWVESGHPLWAVGFATLLAATRVYRGTSTRHEVPSTRPGLVFAPYAALAPAIATVALQSARSEVPPAAVTTLIVVGVLLVIRQHATLAENRSLVERLEATERQLRHRAMHDSLTGLGGRALLHERLDTAVRAYQESGSPVAVVFIDLDDFKQINDVHGHAAGDNVLVAIARRLGHALAPFGDGAVAFRMSGDEFAVLLTGEAAVGACTTARGLLGAISAPIEVDDASVAVTGSVGVAEPGPDVPAEPSALLRAADVAMYGVKHGGKGGVAQAQGEARES